VTHTRVAVCTYISNIHGNNHSDAPHMYACRGCLWRGWHCSKWVTIWHIFALVHRTRTHARIHAHTNSCWLPHCHTGPFSFNFHLELCYPQLAQLSTHSYLTLSVATNTFVYAWAALQICGLSMCRMSDIVNVNVLPQSEARNCSAVRMTLCVVDMHHDQAGYLLPFAAVCVLATAHAWCSSREASKIVSAR